MILLELKVADHRIIQLCLQKSRFNSGLSCQINFFFLIFMQSTFKLTWWIRGSRSRILCRNCVVTFQPRNPSYYKMIKTAVIFKTSLFPKYTDFKARIFSLCFGKGTVSLCNAPNSSLWLYSLQSRAPPTHKKQLNAFEKAKQPKCKSVETTWQQKS